MSPLLSRGCVPMCHPGQVRRWRTRAGIQKESALYSASTGFPFDFAQDREPVERPVEPRISSAAGGLLRNDEFGELSNNF